MSESIRAKGMRLWHLSIAVIILNAGRAIYLYSQTGPGETNPTRPWVWVASVITPAIALWVVRPSNALQQLEFLHQRALFPISRTASWIISVVLFFQSLRILEGELLNFVPLAMLYLLTLDQEMRAFLIDT